MADNVSRLRSSLQLFADVASETVLWDPVGISSSLGSSYSLRDNSYDVLGDTSKCRSVTGNQTTPAGEITPWQPSGISSSLGPMYGLRDNSYDVLGDITKCRNTVEDNVNFTGETVPWQPSGISSSLGPTYGPRDNPYDVPGDLTSTNHAPEFTLPIPVTGGGGAAAKIYYLRARDSSLSLSNPNRYVYWNSTTATIGSYPGSLPGTGPLVDLVILLTR